MNRIVGFAVSVRLSDYQYHQASLALDRALRHFPWLNHLTLKAGDAHLHIWGHGQLEECLCHLPTGNLCVLVGSPSGPVNWEQVRAQLESVRSPEDFALPWDGRVILLQISAGGQRWTAWNDWGGSIPVFHARVGEGSIASTLEPVVVAAAGYTPDDFFLPGLLSLLINGHYLGTWTLFKGMSVAPPDAVAQWDEKGFRWKRLWTVQPSDAHWACGWDELVDRMHALSHKAIADVLQTQSAWILPLSGGLDSRLIAVVGAEIEAQLYAYTYGPAAWIEPIHARSVARALGLPWKRVDLGTDYLARYTRMWCDWFGSALHVHGMYQMPFLESLADEPPGAILQGYLGDPLAGNHLLGLVSTHSDGEGCRPLTNDGVHWTVDEVKALMRVPVEQALEEVSTQVESEVKAVPGEWFQQLMFLDFWNRQRLFIFYQPTVYDYWRGVATPFFNKEYARFCLSLPRLALEGRRLQLEMLRRCYPKVAVMGGTFGWPVELTKAWLLRAGVASLLPRRLRLGPLREFNPTPNTLEPDCVRATGEAALWPIPETWEQLGEWFNLDVLKQVYDVALRGDPSVTNKYEAIQAVALRLLRS